MTPDAIIILCALTTLSLTSLPICWYQNGMRRKLHRNYLSTINAVLESDTR